MEIEVERIYESKSNNDRMRILIDRVWPRGVSKQDAGLDKWLKEIAPSPELRKWFNHDPGRFEDFTQKYKQELKKDKEKNAAVEQLIKYSKENELTLLYGAKDKEHNHAIVLKEYLLEKA